jgi:DNA-directed RNA polymerase sigma subunit (sigma70/sigma32)
MSADEPRMKLILELRGKNESLRSIGRKVNLSYERVRVLLAREERRQAALQKDGVAG